MSNDSSSDESTGFLPMSLEENLSSENDHMVTTELQLPTITLKPKHVVSPQPTSPIVITRHVISPQPTSPIVITRHVISPQPTSPIVITRHVISPQPTSPIVITRHVISPQPTSPIVITRHVISPQPTSPIVITRHVISPQPTSPIVITRHVISPQPTSPIVITSGSESDTELCIVKTEKPEFQHRTDREEIQYHSDSTPIFSQPDKSLVAKEIIVLCLGEFDDTFLCRSTPVSVRYNAVFIVDLHSVSLQSLYADDNGVWKTGSPKSYHKVGMRDGKVDIVLPATNKNYSHYIKRQYGTHQATQSHKSIIFQRIISTVTSKDNYKSRYAVVQYIHRGGSPEDVVMACHGNAKSGKRPFYKTSVEVLTNLKAEPLDSKPKRIFRDYVDKAGGPLETQSAASEPRDVQQIYNIRKSVVCAKKGDDFTHLLSQIKSNDFVHDLMLDKETIQYVLVNEKQLNDMELFCTNPTRFSTFSLDSTYNIGNYYVTNTCYENLKVVHAEGKYRGKHPLEMGPIFIHTKKDTNSFVGFLGSLVRMNSNLQTTQAIGTDGDEALRNAVEICFQDAIKLLCSTHKKENIKRKLKDGFKASEPAITHIVSDLFGRERRSRVYEEGLIDSISVAAFDDKLKSFRTTWEFIVPGFYSWFIKYETDLFKSSLIKEVTDQAQLDGQFSNNRVESVNDNMKDWIGRTGNVDFAVLNTKLEEVVKAQQQEFEMSVYGAGQYELSKTHAYLKKERHVWNALLIDERRRHLELFWNSTILGKPNFIAPLPCTIATCENVASIKPIEQHAFSIDFTEAEQLLTSFPKEMVREIWTQGEGILRCPGSVVKAPGISGMFVQHSPTAKTRAPAISPKLVTIKSGRYMCNCFRFKGSKLCEHVLVAAEFEGELFNFLKIRSKEANPVNLTNLMTADIESGHKPNTRRRGGRRPIDTQPTETTTRQPTIEDTSTNDTLNALDDIDTEEPFELVYLYQTKAISCYGCGTKYNRNCEQNNLIIRKYCEREYTKDGIKHFKLQFAYFHFKMSCVKKKFREFLMEHLRLAKETKDIIPTAVLDKLKSVGVPI